MYQAIDDPYCYRGTDVLKNRLGLRDQTALDQFEAEATAQRFAEPFPPGRFSVSHYRAIHRHIFGDVYPWAGRFRSVRIAKGGSMFCYPEHIATEMARVFANQSSLTALRDMPAQRFAAEIAHFLAELNAVHPFRDGNGRTQLAFLALLADHVGHPLDLDRLEPDAVLAAMIASFHGREDRLVELIRGLIR
ncbi:Fic/DOC family protein [Prosthecodimorpha staleyi]|uniref:protein adenylyltransferase n=1 Tax=Prosthecodimorpha staleyi TaxID=2840188 RepID=A0A947DD47_9HYPH|nr:Fic family protein [Prosthecodimorpha staleyi]MBT9293099.1 Fic family protein [Prosthecodimorpha staleyi]